MVAANGRIRLSLEGIESALVRNRTGDRRGYLESLRKRVAAYERRYELPSNLLREALSSRKLREDLSAEQFLELVGVVGLANATCRLSLAMCEG